MALVKCRECGKDLSSDAKVCPHCGARKLTAMGAIGGIASGIIMIFLAIVVLKSIFGEKEPNGGQPSPKVQETIPSNQDYTNKAEIRKYLHGFKTFNGKNIVSVLNDYSLDVSEVQVSDIQMSHFGTDKLPLLQGDKAGDLLVEVIITGKPKSSLPCTLPKYMKKMLSYGPLSSEIIKRGDKFIPLASNGGYEPLLYWISSNKCSDQYD